MLNLKYAAPSAGLGDYISVYYLFETDEPALEDIERADIAQLRIILRGDGRMSFGPGDQHDIPKVSLVGPRMKATRLTVTGPAASFGMGLLPAGWCALTGLSAHAYANRIMDATGLVTGDLAAFEATVRSATSFEEMVAASEQFVGDIVRHAETPPFRLIRAVDEWLEESLAPDVSVLSEKTGLSAAQLQRQLKAVYGASPKLLARKYRALKTAVRIANGEGVWQDYIGEAYYDQSHCIREIKAFTGITPAAICKTPRLTKATFERRKLKGQISTLATEI